MFLYFSVIEECVDRAKLVAVIAVFLALSGLLVTAVLSLKLSEVQRDLREASEQLKILEGALDGQTKKVVLVNYCILVYSATTCFNNTPIYSGEPVLAVAAMFDDVTLGSRNGTLVILSVKRFPECSQWSLLVRVNSALKYVDPMYPLYGGENIFLRCDG